MLVCRETIAYNLGYLETKSFTSLWYYLNCMKCVVRMFWYLNHCRVPSLSVYVHAQREEKNDIMGLHVCNARFCTSDTMTGGVVCWWFKEKYNWLGCENARDIFFGDYWSLRPDSDSMMSFYPFKKNTFYQCVENCLKNTY